MLELNHHCLSFSEIINKSLSFYPQVLTACFAPICAMAILNSLQNLAIQFFSTKSIIILAFVFAYLSLAPYVLALFRAKTVLYGDIKNYELAFTQVLQRNYLKSLIPFTVTILILCVTGLISFLAQRNTPSLIFLNLPLSFLLILFIFGVALVVLDNIPAVESIRQSASLVWGHWWRCFFIFLILFFIPHVLVIFAQQLLSFNVVWLANLIHFVGMIIVLPLSTASLIVLLHDLKQRANKANLTP